MTKPWQPYALHILEAIGKIRRIEERGSVVEDDVFYAAALRHLQTLSEATQSIPVEKTSRWPDIPWRQISGFRNILVHNYLGDIDPMKIASVIENQLDCRFSMCRG